MKILIVVYYALPERSTCMNHTNIASDRNTDPYAAKRLTVFFDSLIEQLLAVARGTRSGVGGACGGDAAPAAPAERKDEGASRPRSRAEERALFCSVLFLIPDPPRHSPHLCFKVSRVTRLLLQQPIWGGRVWRDYTWRWDLFGALVHVDATPGSV